MRRPAIHRPGILLTLAAAASLGATLHPTAVLTSETTTIRAGTAWSVQGRQFIPDEPVQLVLQGAFDEYDLTEVRATADSTFSVSLDVPADVRPGTYRLAAIVPDGDVAASLDVTIQAAAPDMADHEMTGGEMAGEMADEGAMAHMGSADARADDLPIERSRDGLEWGVIGLFIGLAGGLGMSLVRKPV